jgi:catechol 2,3-dioxygenase-like lactoylglutathione lyase family enzyme
MQTPSLDQQVTFLYTEDLDASAAFYGDVLKLKLVLDQGTCRIYQVTPSAFVGLCKREGARRDSRDVILTLVSDEVDAWHDFLVAQGVPIVKPPTFNEAYNIYHIFFNDPNGYLLEIQTFKDPSWPRV